MQRLADDSSLFTGQYFGTEIEEYYLHARATLLNGDEEGLSRAANARPINQIVKKALVAKAGWLYH